MSMNYFDEWMKETRRAGRLTGTLSGMVKYSSFPNDIKLYIIKALINEYVENADSDSDSHASWIKEWNEIKLELETKIKNSIAV